MYEIFFSSQIVKNLLLSLDNKIIERVWEFPAFHAKR